MPTEVDPRARVDVLVVGAGISGLVVAHCLQRAGLSVSVLEAAERPGGVIRSVAQRGRLYENGPNSALDTSPLIGQLVGELGLAERLRWASTLADRRYVLRNGVPMALPTSPTAFFTTRLFSASAKLALLREPFVPPADPALEESIAAFVRRRLGSEFLDYAIDPFVSGVYAGDPERISVQAAFPKLHALEQRWRSLIRGQVFGAAERRRQQGVAKNSARSFSFDGGMQVLTDVLAAGLHDLHLQTRVNAFSRDADGGFRVQADVQGEPRSWRARLLVLATPADTAANLLQVQAADAAAALRGIDYAPVATVASAYGRAAIGHALDGFGLLVPRVERRRLLGVLFSSSMFEGRAPAGEVMLTSFVGGMRQPPLAALPEDELAALVHGEHQALLGARQAPLFQQVTRWPRAIPQYTLGHGGRLARVLTAERGLPGLFFCANWLGGVAVGDCIKSGHAVADRALLAHRAAA